MKRFICIFFHRRIHWKFVAYLLGGRWVYECQKCHSHHIRHYPPDGFIPENCNDYDMDAGYQE
jgi:hypothetical protein